MGAGSLMAVGQKKCGGPSDLRLPNPLALQTPPPSQMELDFIHTAVALAPLICQSDRTRCCS